MADGVDTALQLLSVGSKDAAAPVSNDGVSTALHLLNGGTLPSIEMKVPPVEQMKQPLSSRIGSATSNFGKGLAETGLSLGTGMIGQIAGGYAGIGQGLKNLVSPGMSAADRVEQVQGAMTYQPRSNAGKAIAGGLDATLGQLPRAADWAGQKASDISGSPMVGAGVNTAIQMAPMLISPALKKTVGAAAAADVAETAKKTALAAPKNDAIITAKQAGYVIPPAEANPTIPNRLIEGFAGQSKIQQFASSKNQVVTNDLVRKGLGIAPDEPISIDALASVRRQAGQAYDTVRGSGRVTVDRTYTTALDDIAARYIGAEKDFPAMAKNDIKAAVDSARVAEFDASSGIDAIKIQREAADKAFRTGDTALGKSHKAIADAIEDQVDRHLQETGQSVADFQAARKLIAQTYDVQKALKENGNIDARVLGKIYEKGRLTGELAQVGQFGSMFKKAAQTGTGNAALPSAWELMGMGAGGAIGVGSHLMAGNATLPAIAASAALAARPLARGAILTKPVQAMMVSPRSYNPSMALQGTNALVGNPAIMNALALTAQQQNNGN